MDLLAKLWIAIPLAAVAVFFWSFFSWAVSGLHRADARALANEDEVMAALRQLSVTPGSYLFPFAHSNASGKDPAFIAKWKAGPAGKLVVFTPNPSMAGNMVASFAVYLVASFLVAYLTTLARPAGSSFWSVFQVATTAGVLAYTIGELPTLIWFQGSTHAKVMAVVDGLVMGSITGAVLAAMWPAAA
jgi:hypothetical protein